MFLASECALLSLFHGVNMVRVIISVLFNTYSINHHRRTNELKWDKRKIQKKKSRKTGGNYRNLFHDYRIVYVTIRYNSVLWWKHEEFDAVVLGVNFGNRIHNLGKIRTISFAPKLSPILKINVVWNSYFLISECKLICSLKAINKFVTFD